MKTETKTAEKILRECLLEYIKPTFPTYSPEQLNDVVSKFLAITEEKNSILKAMQTYADQFKVGEEALEKAFKAGFTAVMWSNYDEEWGKFKSEHPELFGKAEPKQELKDSIGE